MRVCVCRCTSVSACVCVRVRPLPYFPKRVCVKIIKILESKLKFATNVTNIPAQSADKSKIKENNKRIQSMCNAKYNLQLAKRMCINNCLIACIEYITHRISISFDIAHFPLAFRRKRSAKNSFVVPNLLKLKNDKKQPETKKYKKK